MTFQELCKQINLFTKKHGQPYRSSFWVTNRQIKDLTGSYPIEHPLYELIKPTYAYISADSLSTMKKYISIDGMNKGDSFHCLLKNNKVLGDTVPNNNVYYCTSHTPIEIGQLCVKYTSTSIKDRHLPYQIKVRTKRINPFKDMWNSIRHIAKKEL